MKENSAIIQVQLPVEAATFLLNEKRADIHKIEQRMGVEVVLIPNIHMETPNYTITRVRSDDVTEENSRASYEMVELPSEEEIISAANEPKLVKAEAAVKGITPASPAPASKSPAAREDSKKPSIISRIFAALGFGGKKEEAAKESTQRRENARGNRRNRNNRGRDRTTGDRPQNNAGNLQERNPNAAASNDRNRQPQRQNQPNRNERPQAERQQGERPQNEQKPALASALPVEGNNEQRSRRGRNNRRDRGSRNENAARDNTQAQATATTVTANKEVDENSKTFMTAQITEVVSTKPIAEQIPVEVTVTAEPAIVTQVETVAAETAKIEPKAEKPARESKASEAKANPAKVEAESKNASQ